MPHCTTDKALNAMLFAGRAGDCIKANDFEALPQLVQELKDFAAVTMTQYEDCPVGQGKLKKLAAAADEAESVQAEDPKSVVVAAMNLAGAYLDVAKTIATQCSPEPEPVPEQEPEPEPERKPERERLIGVPRLPDDKDDGMTVDDLTAEMEQAYEILGIEPPSS